MLRIKEDFKRQHQIKASGNSASKLNYFETEQNPVPGDPF